MAVNPKIASIIAAAYDKIAVLSLKIIHNYDNGYGESETQKQFWYRVIKTTKIVRLLSKFVEFDDDGEFVAVRRLTDAEVNDHLKYLIKVADIDSLPVAPKIFYRGFPAIRTEGGPGPEGPTGPTGPTGGGRDFSQIGFTATIVVDQFAITDARAARWDYVLYGTGGRRRTGTVRCDWSDDGLTIATPSDIGTDDIVGATIGVVKFAVEKSGTDIVLKATVLSGAFTWNVDGTRYWIPGNGMYAPPVSNSLGNAQIFVGNSVGTAVQRTPGGVLAMSNTGVFSIVAGSIVNADISAGAAIAFSKMAVLTASKLLVSDGAGIVTASAFGVSVLTYISTLSSDAQTQINGKQPLISVTANRALVSNGAGALIAHANTTDSEIGYVNGVTSPIQPQIDALASLVSSKMPAGLVTSGSASYSVSALDYGKVIHLTNVGSRTATLPLANLIPEGRPYWIKDSIRTASALPITVQVSGSDTLEDGSTSFQITGDGDVIGVYSDGVSKWYLI